MKGLERKLILISWPTFTGLRQKKT